MKTDQLIDTIRRLEELILTFLTLSLIVISCLQITLRIFLSSGLSWGDPLMRHMVVWLGLLGALHAVSLNKHISIDLSQLIFSEKLQILIGIITRLFSGVICGFLGYASYRFLRDEMEFGGPTLFSLPSWVWSVLFLPTFFLMAIRYVVSAFEDINRLNHSRW